MSQISKEICHMAGNTNSKARCILRSYVMGVMVKGMHGSSGGGTVSVVEVVMNMMGSVHV